MSLTIPSSLMPAFPVVYLSLRLLFLPLTSYVLFTLTLSECHSQLCFVGLFRLWENRPYGSRVKHIFFCLDDESALLITLNGKTDDHLDMLNSGIIYRLLEEKWKAFARVRKSISHYVITDETYS